MKDSDFLYAENGFGGDYKATSPPSVLSARPDGRRSGFHIHWLFLLGVVSLFIAVYAWGVATYRYHVFPFSILHNLKASLEIGVPRATAAKTLPVAEIEMLSALGYVDGLADEMPELSGVIHHDPSRVDPGWNLYYSWTSPGAEVLNIHGESVHRWNYDDEIWAHVEILDSGGILAMVKNERIRRLTKGSDVVWTQQGKFHHAFFMEGDTVWAVGRRSRIEPRIHESIHTLSDYIQPISLQDGRLGERHYVIEMFLNTPFEHLLPTLSHRDYQPEDSIDVTHLNHIEVFDGSQEARSPLLAKGNFLVCLRNLNTVAIVERNSMKVAWVWGAGNLIFPHHPTLIDDARILVFNNGKIASEVLEVDLSTGSVVWRYGPGESFFTETRGSNQRLSNGNTVVVESDSGYVHEVTREGDIVWTFTNPDVDDAGVRSAIWRMNRYPLGGLPFLAEAAPPLELALVRDEH